MDIYFILRIINQYYHHVFYCLNSSFSDWEFFQVGSYVLSTCLHLKTFIYLIFNICLLFGTIRCFRLILYFSYHNHFSKGLYQSNLLSKTDCVPPASNLPMTSYCTGERPQPSTWPWKPCPGLAPEQLFWNWQSPHWSLSLKYFLQDQWFQTVPCPVF